MPTGGTLPSYPWDALTRIPRSVTRAATTIRNAVGARPTLASFSRSLGLLLGSDVSIAVRYVAPHAASDARLPFIAAFETDGGAMNVVVSAEAPLVTLALSRLLGRAQTPVDPGTALDPSLRGAAAALVVEAARRAEPGLLLRPRHDVAAFHGVRVDATLDVDGRPYAASAVFTAVEMRAAPGPRLASLGDLPLSLSIVAASASLPRSDVAALSAGDVLVPEWIDRPVTEGSRRIAVIRAAAVVPHGASSGVRASVSEDGRIVIVGSVVTLEDGQSGVRGAGHAMAEAETPLSEIALDAPVVVRVEIATVTLAARELASLSAGDVLETGVRLAEPVILRVGEREIARGELVNVDGEIGVKITDARVR